MDYESEISALKRTVLELLEREENRTLMFRKVKYQYKEVKKEYKAVHAVLLKKDAAYRELKLLQQDQNDRIARYGDRLARATDKLNELEDVLEDMA